MAENTNNSNITHKAIVGVLLAIVGFFCVNTYSMLVAIQQDLVELRLKVTEVQSTMITRQMVIEIVQSELIKYIHGGNNGK